MNNIKASFLLQRQLIYRLGRRGLISACCCRGVGSSAAAEYL
jgi:hypothetical protein